jgi:capsular exopolysaccharide synthesis family protein
MTMQPTADPTFSALRRTFEILRKRVWVVLAVFAVGVTGTVLWTLSQPKIYEATSTIVINPQAPRVNKDDEVIELGAGSVMYMRDYYNTQIEVLTSYPIARATVIQGEGLKLYDRMVPRATHSELTDDKRIDLAATKLVKKLTVDQHRDSRIVAIHVRDEDPELAEQLANTQVSSYIAFMLGKRTAGTGQASELLSAQVDEAQKQLRAAEDKIIAFKAAHQLSTQSFDDKQNTAVSELQRYTAALADARIKRIELAAELKQAKALSATDVLESPVFGLGSGNVVADQLRVEYAKAQQKFIEVNAEYGPKSDELPAAKKKVDDLYAQLQAEANRAVGEIEERYKATAQAEADYEALVAQRKKDIEELDKLYAEYAPLVRDQKYATDEYARLTSSLDASHHESQNNMINVDPHEMARDAEQVEPRMKLNVALAALLSLLLGIVLALVLDQLDSTIKSADEVGQLAGSPLLGIIPIVDEIEGDTTKALADRDLYVFRNPTSQAAECCRSIRTNLLFSAAERTMKTITVSSASPREGKTTTSIYLGTIMANSGQRVLLVDTDLRRPRLHNSLGVSKERGLTNVLLSETSYEDAIKTTDVPNLFLMPSGTIPPNPVELLLTNRFRTVLDELAQRFDRIILDSPPVLAVTDAVVLAKHSDGVILVAQGKKTQREDFAIAARRMHDAQAPIVGGILNVIDISDRRYSGYYQYGGYGEPAKSRA